MFSFASIVASVATAKALNELLKFMKGDKTDLDKAFDTAFYNTKIWFKKKYGDMHGSKNNCFFDYAKAVDEIAKLTLLRPKPDIDLIAAIPLQEGKTAPIEVIEAFVKKLRQIGRASCRERV